MIVIIYFLLNAWYGTIDDTHQSRKIFFLFKIFGSYNYEIDFAPWANQSCSNGLLWSQLNKIILYTI
jgi:hypothetical protein